MEEIKTKKEVKLIEKFGFLGFSTSTNIAYNFKSLYYLTFLTMILKIDVLVAGVMLTIGTIWDAVNDPLIALFCANHKFKNGEKVRPYALYCCVPWAITIILLFVNFKLTESLTVIVGLIIYFLFEALYTFLCMPYNTMAALSTHNDEERKSINAFRSMGGCLGSGIGAVAILPIVRLFGGLTDHKVINETDSVPLILTAIVMGIICIIGSLFHYFTSKERVVEIETDNNEKITLFEAYKMLFKCKSWILNMFIIIGYGITVSLIMQNVNYYAGYVLGDSSLATPILAVYLVVALLTGLFGPKLDKLIGRKMTMLVAIAVIVIGKIPFIINPFNMASIYINSLTVGFGSTITFIIFNTNRNNVTDILYEQNHRRIDTLVAGGDNLIAKLAEAGAIQLMTLVYKFTDMNADYAVQTNETINAINAFLGWVPVLVTLAMVFFVLKLDIPKELQKVREENAKASE